MAGGDGLLKSGVGLDGSGGCVPAWVGAGGCSYPASRACCSCSVFYACTAARCLQTPGLAVVLVGERKDSQTYVRNKKKACDEVGIKSFGTDLPETATEEEVLQVGAGLGWA